MRELVMGLAAIALTAAPFSAEAHVTVWPRDSVVAAREKYVVRMPNEKRIATVRLEAEFPPGLRVTAVQQTPGWNVTVTRDGAGVVTGATWEGELPPDQFVEFGVAAVNPKAGESLTWRFVQTYADGSRAEWTGAPGAPTPAPRVTLKAAP